MALNLTGVERHEVQRGQWVVRDPAVAPTFLADVSVQLLAEAPGTLGRVSRVRVDHGTAELLAKLVLADRETLAPGESAYGQLRFEERALVYPGDHLILRSVTPVTTIGGGRVFDPAPHKHGTDPKWRSRLAVLETGPAPDIAELLLVEAFPRGIARRRLEGSPYLWRFNGRKAVETLLAGGLAEVGDGELLFHAGSLAALREQVMETLKQRAAEDAANPFLTLGELRRVVSRRNGRHWKRRWRSCRPATWRDPNTAAWGGAAAALRVPTPRRRLLEVMAAGEPMRPHLWRRPAAGLCPRTAPGCSRRSSANDKWCV